LVGASMHKVKAGVIVGSGDVGVYVTAPGPIQDNAQLFGRSIPPGPEPLIERAANVNVEGEATFHITFEEPAVDFNLSAQRILDIMGSRVFEIAKRIDAEIFKR